MSPARIEPRTTSRKQSLEQQQQSQAAAQPNGLATNGSAATNGSSGTNGKAPASPPSIRIPVLDTVVALYSFTSQNEEELSFQKGERLEIIERPANDPDWWLARSQFGRTGLVPKNYVQVINAHDEEPKVSKQDIVCCWK